MWKSLRSVKRGISLFAVVTLWAISMSGKTIVVTSTIQSAVDSASPGDTVLVPPGTYHESVQVTKRDITIAGSRAAVIDATGFETGIRVGKPGGFPFPVMNGVPVCPHIADPSRVIDRFALSGLTIQNAGFAGVFLTGVRNYRLSKSSYVNNKEYGPFPICSETGLIDANVVEGGSDAGIYVGDSNKATITRNLVTKYPIGIEVENSTNVTVRENIVSDNTVGILVVVLPGLPTPLSDRITIESNDVVRNNLPNPFDPRQEPDNDVAHLPTGTGILNVGGDHVTIRGNRVLGNNSAGVAIIRNELAALDPRIEPFPDHNRVEDNVILKNGEHPDPLRLTTPPADIIYDGTGTANCFDDNIFRTEFPAGITRAFACRDDDQHNNH